MAITRLDALWARHSGPVAFLGRESWILAFCAWNNHQGARGIPGRPAQPFVVLLPHCIQLARCKAESSRTWAPAISADSAPWDVLEETLQRRWEVRLSNRSRRAYREAREYGPDLMVAVACPDRLFKGLTRLPEIPGYTIPLALPHGMCVDTTFSVPHLVAAMEALVEPRTTRPENIQPLHAEGRQDERPQPLNRLLGPKASAYVLHLRPMEWPIMTAASWAPFWPGLGPPRPHPARLAGYVVCLSGATLVTAPSTRTGDIGYLRSAKPPEAPPGVLLALHAWASAAPCFPLDGSAPWFFHHSGRLHRRQACCIRCLPPGSRRAGWDLLIGTRLDS